MPDRPDVDRLRALIGDATFDRRFELVREAGAGGMGRVFEAREQSSGRRVAIKLMTGRAQVDLQRFAAEAEILEQLDHPRVVSYVAHGVTGAGAPYLAMQWLDGESLAERLRRGPLTVAEVVALARQLGEALAHAHGHGVVHRDLKPSNVLLVDGRIDDVRLIDFGVAKDTDGGRDLTHTGQLVGTPGYMAPEQALGRPGLDGRADLFALGCTMYQALTGTSPFPGDEIIEVLAHLLLHDPEPVDAVRPDVPPRLANLVGALLAKEPGARLADARAVVAEAEVMAAALAGRDAAALRTRPVLVPAGAGVEPVTRDERGGRGLPLRAATVPTGGRGRRRMLVAGLAIAAVALGGGLLFALVAGRDLPPPPPPVTRVMTQPDAGPAGPGSGAGAAPTSPGPTSTFDLAACTIDIRLGCEARCAAGEAEACHYWGESLSTGLGGVRRDEVAGVAMLVHGCELGSGRACTKAGLRILRAREPGGADLGLPASEAQRVLQLGCSAGSAHTCRWLGKHLMPPDGELPADAGRAYDALIRGCDLGDAASCWSLVEPLAQGRGDAAAQARARDAIAGACARGGTHPTCTK
ncbi:MAG: protein kinase [Kofleriaceae bacterium]|nr:protein kinase [Kofleriaceae bacterium]